MIDLKKIQSGLFITILILINIAGSYYFFRIDLTEEKKYSISKETKNLLHELDDIIYFKIYLHGEMPIEYNRLASETKYILNEFRAHSKFIEYEFINPSAMENETYQLSLQEELYNKGIMPIPEKKYGSTKREEFLIFPGIIASYKSKEIPISLINHTLMNDRNMVIEKSINQLEYLITNGIRKLKTQKKQTIGLLQGHGEITNQLIYSFKNTASEHYQLLDVTIDGQLKSLENIDCVIINNPVKRINEKDKFILDQFIMNGGKTIWILNGTNANMDSLETQSETIILPLANRNLDDLLFKYGVRINFDLVQDLQAAPIPVVTHYIQDKPQWDFFPWVFFPVISPNKKHIINKATEPIKTIFPSSIDTIKNGITKTILLKTSPHTKLNQTPSLINLESLKTHPNKQDFNSGSKNIAVLLSGHFESLFKNRVNPIISKNADINFKAKSVDNKMIVISDGHFLNNQFFQGNPLPLGLDKHTGVNYGNSDFILNSIDYLLNNEPFIHIRSKNIKNRPLDMAKIQTEKTYWQLINLTIPLLLIIICRIILLIIRKRKYKI
tara:strand:+ start:334 stop:2001 length:1668 start_codon:yes stop_codon:yes gene_type:complete